MKVGRRTALPGVDTDGCRGDALATFETYGGLLCLGRVEVVTQRRMGLLGDEAHAVCANYR